MKMKIILTFLAAAFPMIQAHAREWTDDATKHTLTGEFLRVEGDQVVLTRPNGTSVKVAIPRLIQEDRDFIAKAQEDAKAAAEKEEAAKVKGRYEWHEEFEKAQKLAKALKKPMLLDFTGSDWCGWCMKLKKEVFDEKEFQRYAEENLILVELDFPRSKNQKDSTQKQNEKLKQEYGVRGFPTIILLDHRGKKIGQTGYKEGGPKAYVEHLKELIEKGS